MDAMFFFIFVVFLPFVNSNMIHKHMTKEEVHATFQNGQGPVPEYEVVPVFHSYEENKINKESKLTVRVNAFKKDMSLYLEPNDGILAHFSTPVWTAKSNKRRSGSVEYSLVKNAFAKIGRPYLDPSNGTSIVAYEGQDGKTLMLGNLHSNLVIRPLPHRLHKIISKETERSNNSLPNFSEMDKNFRQTHHHVVFKKHEPDTNSRLKTVKSDKLKFGNKRSRRSIPQIIYPEILVIVDYTLFAALEKNLEKTTRYILALWNGVDLRYRLLAQPMIRLNIAGIIISLENGGTPYLDNNRRDKIQLDADLAITDMSHYFYKESSKFHFSSYDIAIAMTSLDMCNIVYNDICDTSTLGYAYEWGACNRSHIDKNTEAVGIIEDNGGFKAIIATAHEVAHLMGASHDGFDDGIGCPGSSGFIMSSMLHIVENSFTWSECSLRDLYEFFSSAEASCLFNQPRSGSPLPRLLPGKIMSLDDQCKKIYGTKACHYDERVCTKLECYLPGKSKLCNAPISAAEGSYCGKGRHCINGYCVSDNINFVPYKSSTTIAPFGYDISNN